MKKILGLLVCILTLVGGAIEAQASYIKDWTYTLGNTLFVSGGGFNSTVNEHSYELDYTPGTTGSLTLNAPVDGGGALIPDSKIFDLTVTEKPAGSDPVYSMNYMTAYFSYSAVAHDPETGKDIEISAFYEIPFQYYYDGNGTEYVFYQVSPVGFFTPSLSDVDGTDGEYIYSLGKMQLSVNGAPLETWTADDGSVYAGFAIDDLTSFEFEAKFHLNYSKPGGELTPTPEPATLLLMGIGLASFGFVARCRKNA